MEKLHLAIGSMLHFVMNKEGFVLLYGFCCILYVGIAAFDESESSNQRDLMAKANLSNRFNFVDDSWNLFIRGLGSRAGVSANVLLLIYRVCYLLFLFGMLSFVVTTAYDIFFKYAVFDLN